MIQFIKSSLDINWAAPKPEHVVKSIAIAIATIVTLGIVLASTSTLIREKFHDHRSLQVDSEIERCRDLYRKFSCFENHCLKAPNLQIDIVEGNYGDRCIFTHTDMQFIESSAVTHGVLCSSTDECLEFERLS